MKYQDPKGSQSQQLTFDELEKLADEIIKLVLDGEGATLYNYIKRAKEVDFKLFGYRKLHALCNEDYLSSYFPDEVYTILRARADDYNEKSNPRFLDDDKRFLLKNEGHSPKWFAKRFNTHQDIIRRKAKSLNLYLENDNPHEYEEIEDDFIIKHIDIEGAPWIASQLHMGVSAIKHRAKALKTTKNIERRPFSDLEIAFIKKNAYRGDQYLCKCLERTPSSIQHKRLSLCGSSQSQPNRINMKRIGILGGAFDPITKGHMQLAEFVLKNSDLNEVWITPCYIHRYEKDMVPENFRIEMINLTLNKDARIKLCTYEIDNKLMGKTFKLMMKMMGDPKYIDCEFSYIIGMDNANSFDQWFKNDILQKMIRFIVVSRQGEKIKGLDWYKNAPHIFLNAKDEIIKSSSTEVRKLVEGCDLESLNKYIAKEVIAYISQYSLYEKGDQQEEI